MREPVRDWCVRVTAGENYERPGGPPWPRWGGGARPIGRRHTPNVKAGHTLRERKLLKKNRCLSMGLTEVGSGRRNLLVQQIWVVVACWRCSNEPNEMRTNNFVIVIQFVGF